MSEKRYLEIQNGAFSIEFERAIRPPKNKYISATSSTSATNFSNINTTKTAEPTPTPTHKKIHKKLIKQAIDDTIMKSTTIAPEQLEIQLNYWQKIRNKSAE